MIYDYRFSLYCIIQFSKNNIVLLHKRSCLLRRTITFKTEQNVNIKLNVNDPNYP